MRIAKPLTLFGTNTKANHSSKTNKLWLIKAHTKRIAGQFKTIQMNMHPIVSIIPYTLILINFHSNVKMMIIGCISNGWKNIKHRLLTKKSISTNIYANLEHWNCNNLTYDEDISLEIISSEI